MFASLALAVAIATAPPGSLVGANRPAGPRVDPVVSAPPDVIKGAARPRAATARSAKIVFLPEDFTNGYDHRGGTARLLVHLEKYVATRAPASHVRLDVRKLLRNGVEPYYIYDKQYCRPIGRVLGANIFVMARLTAVDPGPLPNEEPFDVEAKAYSSETGREVRLIRASRIRAKDLPKLIQGNEEELLLRVLSVLEAGEPADGDRR